MEGEKGVHALESLGLTATCSPGGAEKWLQEYSSVLAGADVAIFDNDEPGRKHEAQVRKRLKGIAGRVRVLALPGLAEKADVFDWISNGGNREARQARGGAGDRATARRVRIPTHRGHLLRFDPGQATDLMAATIPI